MNLIDFLKTYSKISNKFIDDFFSLYDLTNKNNSKQNNIIVLIPKLITGTTIFIGITYLIIKMFLI